MCRFYKTFAFHAVLVFCFIPLPFVANADEAVTREQDPPVQRLHEIVITDTRLPSVKGDIKKTPAHVTVITSEDIKKSGAKTVQEALKNINGVIWYNQVGNNFEQRVDLRGFNGEPQSTSVFVDGVLVNEPELNQVNFDLIPFETIDRIEVIPGPSAIFGKNALGGVINITTKTGATPRQVTGEVLLGSFGRQRYTANTSGPIGDFNYYANFSQETEDGFRDESDGRITRLVGRLGYEPTEDTNIALAYNYVNSDLKQAGSLPINIAEVNPQANFTPGDFVKRENDFLRFNLRHVLPQGFVFSANAFYRKLEQDSFLNSQPFTIGGMNTTSLNLSNTQSWGGVAQVTHQSAPFGFENQLVLGGELKWNDFGNHLTALSDFGPFEVRRETDEEISAFYVEDTINLTSNLIISGGVRYDRDELDFMDLLTPVNNGIKVFERLTPRASITYLFSPQLSGYFTYSQGFRVPTNEELFALGAFGSNPDLQPVRAKNFELGFKGQMDSWARVTVAVYQIDVRDEIFFTCILCDFSPNDGQNRNVPKTQRRGVEATLIFNPNRYFEGVINYSYTQAEYRSQFNFSSTKVVEDGDTIPLVPKNRLSLTGTVHPFPEWSFTLNGLYVGEQVFQNDENNVRPLLPDYFVLNSRLAYERPVSGGIFTAFFAVENMTNSNYFTSGIYAANRITGGGAIEAFVVPAQSVTFLGGITYRFENFPG